MAQALEGIETRLYINGEWFESPDQIHLVRPFDEQPLCSVHSATVGHIDAAVSAALLSFPAWRDLGPLGRKPFFRRLSALMREHATEFAALNALNLGRSSELSNWEVQHSADIYEYYAEAAIDIVGETRVGVDGRLDFEIRQPYGVVGAIIPWNVPTMMFAMKTGAALAAGNTIVMKSSEKAPLTSLLMASLMHKAGFPAGVVNILSGLGPVAGARLAEHPDVRKLSFTGSTATGRLLQKVSAETNMKKYQLELGGKSACIVFADADLEKAAELLANSFTFLSGQACIASSRVLVEESVMEEFMGHFRTFVGAKEMNVLTDPTLDCADGLSPLVDEIQFKKVLAYIEEGKRTSAKPVIGGHRIGSKGYFVAPCIFENLPQSSRLIQEEIFGPVVCVNTFKTEQEALALANDTQYGLYASAFSKDVGRLMRCAKGLDAGMVGLNVTSPDLVPGFAFGGYKSSGSGRDAYKHGLLTMVEQKTVGLVYGTQAH
ncbi:aldehyde dehydrogenase domain-containing protein [Pyronema omphalodes]|nr:aldehyde dehydrogenase domain-containing protein [Pyronema omphalodes]